MEKSSGRFFINISSYALCSLLFTFLMIELPLVAFILTAVLCVLFLVFSDHSVKWTYFMYIKRYSIFISIVLYAFMNFFYQDPQSAFWSNQNQISQVLLNPNWVYVFAFVLFINMMELSVLDLCQKDYKSKINGMLILGLALLTPINWSTKDIIGFDNPIWVLTMTSCFIFMFLNNPWFHEKKISYINIVILLLSIVGVFLYGNNWQYWMGFRAYTLYFSLMQFSFFPKYSHLFYYDFSKISYVIFLKKYVWIWIVLNFILLICSYSYRPGLISLVWVTH